MSRPAPFTLLAAAVGGALAWLWRATLYQAVSDRIAQGLRGYVVRPNFVDARLPVALPDGERPKVAVIGAGLAGMRAASVLARRGFEVTLYEAKDHLGGKLGAWTETMPDGTRLPMEHGFHAFFGCYYNLDRFLTELGVDDRFGRVDDYVILQADGRRLSFQGVTRVPFLNILHILWLGLFDWKEVLLNPAVRRLDPLLHYVRDDAWRTFDDVSFDRFARDASLPSGMRTMFTTFTRAFFARADQMSMAALLQSFHLYYLSNDRGLDYRYPLTHHGSSLLDPLRAHLEGLGVRIALGTPVTRLARQKNGRLKVNGAAVDHVVLAADSKGALAIAEQSELIPAESPLLVAQLRALRNPNRYAVLRLWCDKDVRGNLPVFTFTEKLRVLDSVTACHRAEAEHARWVHANGGAVLELHGYEVPDRYRTREEIRAALLADLQDLFPETAGLQSRYEAMHVGDDFSAFHVGMARHRPGTRTTVPGLVLAGDWVQLPYPAMLMEAAVTSGLTAANAILGAHGLREEQIYSVPLRGLLDGA